MAVGDAATVNEGAAVNINLAVNDTDANNAVDITSIVIASGPTNGAVVVNADGTVDYTHDGGETTTDSFTYTIDDEKGATSNAATVTVTITPVNDAPVANNDTATVSEGLMVVIDLAANDTDADDGLDLTSIVVVTAPANGAVGVNADGTVDYTHDGSETISDSFTYTINDNSGATSNIATVNITVSPVNDTPVANNDAATLNEGATANIDLAANDTDPENSLDLTSIVVVAAPTNGAVVINANGTVDYTHDGSETIGDSFTYTINDTGGATSNVATVTITVTPVNDAPVANDDSTTLNEGATVLSLDLAANDTDADDGLDITTIAIVTGPANGTIDAVNADGTVDYTHNGGETISDSFTYTINDNAGLTSNIATVTITVTPVNDVPVANNDTVSINVGQQVIFDLAANDTDADDGLDLTSIVVSATTNGGTVDLVNADGTVTYTAPSGTAITSDSFTYTINDLSAATSNTATVTITVLQDFNEALYAAPTVSASLDASRALQANDGLSGVVDANNGWVSSAALPQTARLTFDTAKLIHRITLSDLAALTDNVLTGTITFSNGDPAIPVGALPTDGTAQEYLLSPPKLVTWIEVSIDTADSVNAGLSEFSAFSALDPGQTIAFTELFNDSDAAIALRWPITDECTSGTSTWSGLDGVVALNNEYVQSDTCRGFSTEGVELGSYPVLDAGQFNTENMDLRLRFKSGGTGNTWVNGALGVMFAYRSTDHYRLDVSQVEGHTKLWKKVAGAYSELTTSPQSYTPGQWVNLRIVRQNDVIVVYMNDVKTMAAQDSEGALKNASFQQIALLCARNEDCQFENVTVLTAPSTPIIGANIVEVPGHSSGEYYVDTAGSLDIVAVVTDNTSITEVEFVADEGQPGAVTSIDADGAPYTATFGLLAQGDHTIRTYLRDATGRLSGSEAMEELPQVGVSGIHLIGLGDSITGGLRDDDPSDDKSADGRNTSGGYQPILNDLLTTANGPPVTILNEGNPGELSAEGAVRIAAVLARTPSARGYLAIYGANDSSAGAGPVASGLGLNLGDPGYAGSFKDNMQQIIDAVVGAGKIIYLGKTLPFPLDAGRNTIVIDYNTVIDNLVTSNALGYTAADFHTWFTNNPLEMDADGIHPNGAGYKSMANNNQPNQNWCDTLNGQDGMVCP